MTTDKPAPACACGCGKRVEESRKHPGTWNRYWSRHGSRVNREQYGEPPGCVCGCGRAVSWGWNRWHAYADTCTPNRDTLSFRYMTKQELARKLKLSERTIERQVKKKKLPRPVRVKVRGRSQLHVVFRVSDLVKKRVL